MRAPILVIAVVTATLAAMLTRPDIRAEISDGLDTSRPIAVARTVCTAEAQVGREEFIPCMRRLIPNLPVAWPVIPAQID